MMLTFHLVQAKVRELGGCITRLSNLFVKDADFVGCGGELHSEFQAPPSIFIHFQISGWSMEIMLTLVDVIEAKARLHKFYDIVRAQKVEEVLMPVFDTQDRFPTDDMAGAAVML